MNKQLILVLIISTILLGVAYSTTNPSESCVNVKIYNPVSNETDEKCFRPPVTFIKTSTGYCAQVTAYAISPDDLCGEFTTPCDIPFDWEWVDSCDNPEPVETITSTVIGGGNVITSGPVDVVIEGLGNIGDDVVEVETIIISTNTITIDTRNGQGDRGRTTANANNNSNAPTIVNVEVVNSNSEFTEINIAPIPDEEIVVIESGGVIATTQNEITIINSTLVISDGDNLHPIDFLPDEALERVEAANDNAIVVDSIELSVQNNAPVFEIIGRRQADFLSIIPVEIEIVTTVNAQTGQIINERRPFWSFLTRGRSKEVSRSEFGQSHLFDEINNANDRATRQERREGQRDDRVAAAEAQTGNST